MREIITQTLLLSALLQLLLCVYAWSRRDEVAARPLAITFFIGFTWAFTYSMDLASNDVGTKMVWMFIRLTFIRFISLGTLWIAYEQLERSHKLRKHLPTLLIIPILGILLIWTGSYHSLFRYEYTIRSVGELQILAWKTGSLYWLVYFFDIVVYAIALYQLVRSFSASSLIKRRQTGLITAGLFAPLISDLLYTFGISPIPGFNFTPFFLVFSEALLAYAIFRYGWLRIVPIARSTLVDIIPSGVIVIDAKNRVVDINPYAQNILNLSAQQALGRDAQAVFASLGPYLVSILEMEQGNKEIRSENPGRKTEYFDVEVLSLENQPGRANGRLIHFTNITSRKENELRLLQLTQAVEQSPASVVITNPKGNILYVNPQFTVLTGYTFDEVRGKNPSIIQSGQTPEAVYKKMWQTIQSGDSWRGEFLNKKKNGELYWELEVIAPVLDHQKAIINYIAVKEDITQRKQSEAALQKANQQLENQLKEIEQLQATLREQAIRDSLTQLYNRHFLNEAIEREFHRAVRLSQPFSVVILDIDHFKAINDTYGHKAGDAYLVMAATLLQQHVRKSDIVCRYGGEEFLLVLPDTNVTAAAQHAEKLRRLFEEASQSFEGHDLTATISVGIASYPTHGIHDSEIIDKADQALYVSKRAGRNRVTVSSSEVV